MDIESRLRRIESDVRRTRLYTGAVLVVLVVLLGLAVFRAEGSGEWTVAILVVLTLAVVAHLLVSAASGLRVFWGRRDADAQLQEKILREFLAERAKSRDSDHP
jgi:hypothetical protein